MSEVVRLHWCSSVTCGSAGIAANPPPAMCMVPPNAVRWMTRPLLPPPTAAFLGVLVRLSGSGVLRSNPRETIRTLLHTQRQRLAKRD